MTFAVWLGVGVSNSFDKARNICRYMHNCIKLDTRDKPRLSVLRLCVLPLTSVS